MFGEIAPKLRTIINFTKQKITGVLGLAHGGTGLSNTTPTAGYLLNGNATGTGYSLVQPGSGAGLSNTSTGNTFNYSLVTPVTTGHGGTGTNTTPTTGQVLIGNTTGTLYAPITPTAGTGLSVTANASTLSYALSTPVANANGGTGSALFAAQNGRLYTVSGSPYADGSSAGNTTIYFGPCPDRGNLITLDNGSGVLSTYTLTEITQALSGLSLTSTDAYDVYLYNNSGTLTLAVTVWSNTTTPPTRSTDAAGRLTKSGATNYLLVGAVYATGTNTVSDWNGDRSLWNMYNRVQTSCFAQIGTATWTTTSTTPVSANSNTTLGQGRFRVFTGYQIEPVSMQCFTSAYDSAAGDGPEFGIGVDSTSAYTVNGVGIGAVAFNEVSISVGYNLTQLGSHFYQQLNSVDLGGTGTFSGNTANALQGTTWR